MTKFCVIGDPQNRPNCSSKIIIDNINDAAVKLGLYDREGVKVNYSCLCDDFGLKTDVFISVFESAFPTFILDNAKERPILNVSRDGMIFALDGGYPSEKVSYVCLGVRSDLWKVGKSNLNKNKFRILTNGESNSRSCLVETIQAFGELFAGRKDIELYIRDREATDLFKQYVKDKAKMYNGEIIHDDRALTNIQDEIDIYATADFNININKSSTWNLRAIESLSCSVPTISIEYSGNREYSQHCHSTLNVDYRLEKITDEDLDIAQNLGLRNYLFYPSQYKWAKTPYWAVPSVQSIKDCMHILYESKEMRDRLSFYGRKMAEYFSWERTAQNLSWELSRLLKS